MIWGRRRSRVKAMQMNNFRGLLGIKKMDSVECKHKRIMWSEDCSGIVEEWGLTRLLKGYM